MQQKNLNKLQEELKAYHKKTGQSHYHSSASVLPILFNIKNIMKPQDICLLSKAHAISAYELVFKGSLPDTKLVQNEFGSLGTCLPFALGVAYMNPNVTIYVVCGDGEMQEGSNLEAIEAMDRLNINNVRIFVDENWMQGMGDVPCSNRSGPLNISYVQTYKGEDWTCHYKDPI